MGEPEAINVVTGGAGFIGSHLSERLLEEGGKVVAVDDLSNGQREWVPTGAEFVEDDLSEPNVAEKVIDADVDHVYHLSARKDVKDDNPAAQFEENTRMTQNVLRAASVADVDRFVYASSSAVYGEAPRPTSESYGPLKPISLYGASKLADEGLISSYAKSDGFEAFVFRFANVVGPRLRNAVIPDFIEKLRKNPERLEILGNGRQTKSYIHVDDCVAAMTDIASESSRKQTFLEVYNLGTGNTTSVNEIADTVSRVIGVDPEYDYTGGDRGWEGDVPEMNLSIEKALETGWKPNYDSDEAVRRAAVALSEEI